MMTLPKKPQKEKTVYLTAKSAATKKAKCLTIHGATPEQVIEMIKRAVQHGATAAG